MLFLPGGVAGMKAVPYHKRGRTLPLHALHGGLPQPVKKTCRQEGTPEGRALSDTMFLT